MTTKTIIIIQIINSKKNSYKLILQKKIFRDSVHVSDSHSEKQCSLSFA